jgi:predicted MPP superfamily phosphohydrolase
MLKSASLATHQIVDVDVVLPRLPAVLDGFTIVQLSDLHVGPTIDRRFVQDLVDRCHGLGADLYALTGDLVDGSVRQYRDAAAPLGELRAPHGVFAVTGNHEYYHGADPWIAELGSLGVRYLRNQRVAIERDGAVFDLAGIDDHEARAPGHGPDVGRATAGRDLGRPLVLLAHQPRQVHAAARAGVDLQLSGHTHGGQIWPWHYLVKLQQGGLLAGRYRFGDTQLYVTRGCGFWGPRVRIGAPLEITRVILRA